MHKLNNLFTYLEIKSIYLLFDVSSLYVTGFNLGLCYCYRYVKYLKF